MVLSYAKPETFPVTGDPHVDELGLFLWHDWPAIDELERAGQVVDPDDHLQAVEDVATGTYRQPAPAEVERIKAVTRLARMRRMRVGIPPEERGRC